jgi:hypothetical protein
LQKKIFDFKISFYLSGAAAARQLPLRRPLCDADSVWDLARGRRHSRHGRHFLGRSSNNCAVALCAAATMTATMAAMWADF